MGLAESTRFEPDRPGPVSGDAVFRPSEDCQCHLKLATCYAQTRHGTAQLQRLQTVIRRAVGIVRCRCGGWLPRDGRSFSDLSVHSGRVYDVGTRGRSDRRYAVFGWFAQGG